MDPGGATGVAGVKDFVTNIAQGVIAFAALFAVGAIVFAGIRYTTSYGEDEKHKSAKDTAIAALIGLALCLIAFPLVELIVNFFYSLGEK